MQRRDFLRLASGGAMALATWPPADSIASVLASAPAAPGSAPAVAYRSEWSARSIDARRLPAGDPVLGAEGVRLSVFGLAPEHVGWSGRASLDVRFPCEATEVVYHAWAVDDASATGTPAVSSFPVPIGCNGLELEATWEGEKLSVRLSTADGPEAPKLRTGIYLLGGHDRPAVVMAIDPVNHPRRVRAPWRAHHV